MTTYKIITILFFGWIFSFWKNLIGSPRGKYFHQKRHLWVKKYKSSNIMVIVKGDAFKKKMSPSVTKCHLWPKKLKFSVILTIAEGDTFFQVKIRTLLSSLPNKKPIFWVATKNLPPWIRVTRASKVGLQCCCLL